MNSLIRNPNKLFSWALAFICVAMFFVPPMSEPGRYGATWGGYHVLFTHESHLQTDWPRLILQYVLVLGGYWVFLQSQARPRLVGLAATEDLRGGSDLKEDEHNATISSVGGPGQGEPLPNKIRTTERATATGSVDADLTAFVPQPLAVCLEGVSDEERTDLIDGTFLCYEMRKSKDATVEVIVAAGYDSTFAEWYATQVFTSQRRVVPKIPVYSKAIQASTVVGSAKTFRWKLLLRDIFALPIGLIVFFIAVKAAQWAFLVCLEDVIPVEGYHRYAECAAALFTAMWVPCAVVVFTAKIAARIKTQVAIAFLCAIVVALAAIDYYNFRVTGERPSNFEWFYLISSNLIYTFSTVVGVIAVFGDNRRVAASET